MNIKKRNEKNFNFIETHLASNIASEMKIINRFFDFVKISYKIFYKSSIQPNKSKYSSIFQTKLTHYFRVIQFN